MAALFDPARHEALTRTPWRDDAARQAIAEIAADAVAACEGEALWPAHPLDDPEPPTQRFFDLYLGAGGVIWALRRLAHAGAAPAVPAAIEALVPTLASRLVAAQRPKPGERPSFLLGESGLLLLQWQSTRDAALAQRLFECIESNAANPTLEALWGSPGTLLAAVHMAEATAEPRWAALIAAQLEQLLEALTPDPETGLPVWVQDMYGHQVRYLGAGHGLVGNVYTALRAGALVPAALRDRFLDLAERTLQTLAVHDGEAIGWHPMSDAARAASRLPLVQDCHGAPGMLNRLAGRVPRNAAWDRLLTGAGEATWRAGPLAKGPSICHGSAGNALALMKLGAHLGDERWWQRGRALAWHAAEQARAARGRYGRGRYSLWTGDLGVACVLQAGLSGRAELPTFDVF